MVDQKRLISDDCFTFLSVAVMRGWICHITTMEERSSLYLNVILNQKILLRLNSALHHSDGLVWVEHDSDVGASSTSRNVLGEFDSNHTVVSVSAHDGTPLDSVSGVVGSVFNLVNVGNSLTHVPLGGSKIGAVLDHDEGLVLLLMILGSSETCEDTLLIESNWLSLVVDLSTLLSICGFSFLYHSFSFVIMIIQ